MIHLIIGIVGFQGDVDEHVRATISAGKGRVKEVRDLRRTSDFRGVSGLIIPGGESTTIYKLLINYGIYSKIKDEAEKGLPVMGTCAGLILISRDTGDPAVKGMGLIDAIVSRNAYGRQKESFIGSVEIAGSGEFRAPFIRAPKIVKVPESNIIGRCGDEPVMIRHNNVLGLTFHPELTRDTRLHSMFLEMVEGEGYISTGD